MIKINDPVTIFANAPTCNNHCFPVIEYTQTYVLPTNDDCVLAVIPVKDYSNPDDFFNKVFGKSTSYKFRKVAEDGYICRPVDVDERNARLDELYTINTSTDERQGGKMNETYCQYPEKWEKTDCPHHFIKTYGAFAPDGTWIGYIDVVFAGEWTNTKHLLGHKQYLNECKRGSFMVNLWFCLVKDIMENHSHINYIQYHLMGVGNPGLDEWKKRVGLREALII